MSHNLRVLKSRDQLPLFVASRLRSISPLHIIPYVPVVDWSAHSATDDIHITDPSDYDLDVIRNGERMMRHIPTEASLSD